ncbi:MAG TPA: hypothetical protein VGK81_03790 [Anaerolineae bacterium]
MDKVLRAFSVGIILFATVIAFIVGSRIDQNTVSLLSGAMVGIVIAAPCAVLVTFIAVRRRENNNISVYERSIRHGYQMPPSPPQYWVMPPQFQASAQTAPAIPGGLSMSAWPGSPEQLPALPRRRFYVIGENGEPTPVDNEAATDAAYPFDPDETGAAF